MQLKVAWVYKFLKRKGCSITRVTHKGQIMPENSEILKKEFLSEIAEIGKTLDINFEDTYLLINLDETPFYILIKN